MPSVTKTQSVEELGALVFSTSGALLASPLSPKHSSLPNWIPQKPPTPRQLYANASDYSTAMLIPSTGMDTTRPLCIYSQATGKHNFTFFFHSTKEPKFGTHVTAPNSI